jgi:hypothetical protein
VYSTFVGGDSADRTNALALGHDGSVKITGFTARLTSRPPPTPRNARSAAARARADRGGAHRRVRRHTGLVRSRLVCSTFLGGSGEDTGNPMSLDDAGNRQRHRRTAAAPAQRGALDHGERKAEEEPAGGALRVDHDDREQDAVATARARRPPAPGASAAARRHLNEDRLPT